MSAEATFWAWKQDLRSTQKLVLLSLANCHNESTGLCNPSIVYIANSTGLNRKTVMSSLAALEEIGLLIPHKKHGSGSQYFLKTEQTTSTENGSTKNGTSTKIDQSQKRDQTSTENGHNQSQKRDTNLKESKKNLKDKALLPEWLDESVWSEYEKMRTRIKKPMTDYAKKLAFADLQKLRAQGFNPTEILNNSIKNSWQGLFAPKGTGNATSKPLSAVDKVRQATGQHESEHPFGGESDGSVVASYG